MCAKALPFSRLIKGGDPYPRVSSYRMLWDAGRFHGSARLFAVQLQSGESLCHTIINIGCSVRCLSAKRASCRSVSRKGRTILGRDVWLAVRNDGPVCVTAIRQFNDPPILPGFPSWESRRIRHFAVPLISTFHTALTTNLLRTHTPAFAAYV